MSIVAIVGRPNVGKSTLFNRILGQRKAIVEDYPGVTRDRNYAEVTRYDKPFTLIDTGGFEPDTREEILAQMRTQSQLAVEDADVILMVMDGKEGLNPADREVVGALRRSGKPVLFVVNKVDGERDEEMASEFYGLGIDAFHTVSAEHGRGVRDLLEELMTLIPEPTRDDQGSEDVRLAVIGRPNVGKSSLVNRLLGFERVVVNPLSGTTRDSVDSPFVYNQKRYQLIDTAGIRRKGKVSVVTEKYSVVQALKAMDRADVVLVLVDAEEGVTEQDLTVAGYAHEKGRAVVLVVNKWDLVKKDERTMGEYVKRMRESFRFLPDAPIVFVSALSGQRVSRIMGEVEKVVAEYRKKVPTAQLNTVLQDAVLSKPPSVYRGKRLKFFYITQAFDSPPGFVVFVSEPDGIHFSYQRYLVNKLREAFGFVGVPVRLHFRKREH
ncbi:MAG: ribosome biogenesis GTPase Der [Desulfuromonas sp.]|nr:MAG: ribosome biogenesis GTPase Der [Desulfuromonas sp.]